MRPLARLAVLMPLVLALGGCITSQTLVKLKADGSGTVEQTILMNAKTLEMIPKMMSEAMGGGEVKSTSKGTSPLDALDEDKLRADAGKLGKGVRYVSSEKLVQGDMEGAKVIYEFDDINALAIDQDPPAGGLGEEAPAKKDKLDFRLTRQPNGRAIVTVLFDEPKDAAPAEPSGPAPGMDDMPPEVAAMMAQMFDGFRVAIDVEVDGEIVETSSPFVEGSRVTVLELDLGQLIKDPANLKVLEKLGPGASVSEMIPLLKDIKGIKVNQSPLTIEFAGR